MEEVVAVAVRKDRDDAMSDHDAELDHLDDCYQRLHMPQDRQQRFVRERAQEVVEIHEEVDDKVDKGDVDSHQF